MQSPAQVIRRHWWWLRPQPSPAACPGPSLGEAREDGGPGTPSQHGHLSRSLAWEAPAPGPRVPRTDLGLRSGQEGCAPRQALAALPAGNCLAPQLQDTAKLLSCPALRPEARLRGARPGNYRWRVGPALSRTLSSPDRPMPMVTWLVCCCLQHLERYLARSRCSVNTGDQDCPETPLLGTQARAGPLPGCGCDMQSWSLGPPGLVSVLLQLCTGSTWVRRLLVSRAPPQHPGSGVEGTHAVTAGESEAEQGPPGAAERQPPLALQEEGSQLVSRKRQEACWARETSGIGCRVRERLQPEPSSWGVGMAAHELCCSRPCGPSPDASFTCTGFILMPSTGAGSHFTDRTGVGTEGRGRGWTERRRGQACGS